MLYAGIGVHRMSSYVSVIDEKGNRVAQRNLPSDVEAITAFLSGLPELPAIVMESTSARYWLYDGLSERGYAVVVSDPHKTKAIASARIKHDKLDAHMLTQLLRADMVATVYVSPPEYRDLKELLRHRVRLVRDKRRMKNRIHNLLAKNNINPAKGQMGRKKGIKQDVRPDSRAIPGAGLARSCLGVQASARALALVGLSLQSPSWDGPRPGC